MLLYKNRVKSLLLPKCAGSRGCTYRKPASVPLHTAQGPSDKREAAVSSGDPKVSRQTRRRCNKAIWMLSPLPPHISASGLLPGHLQPRAWGLILERDGSETLCYSSQRPSSCRPASNCKLTQRPSLTPGTPGPKTQGCKRNCPNFRM